MAAKGALDTSSITLVLNLANRITAPEIELYLGSLFLRDSVAESLSAKIQGPGVSRKVSLGNE